MGVEARPALERRPVQHEQRPDCRRDGIELCLDQPQVGIAGGLGDFLYRWLGMGQRGSRAVSNGCQRPPDDPAAPPEGSAGGGQDDFGIARGAVVVDAKLAYSQPVQAQSDSLGVPERGDGVDPVGQ